MLPLIAFIFHGAMRNDLLPGSAFTLQFMKNIIMTCWPNAAKIYMLTEITELRRGRIMTLIVLNFKTYRESTGLQALRLAEICEDISRDYSVQMVVVPQVADIQAISNAVKIPVYAQHVDGVGYGGFTGHVTAASLKAAGATGSLINHSERRLKLAEIEASISACRQAGLKTIVCTNNVATTRAAAAIGAGLRGCGASRADRQRHSRIQSESRGNSRFR